MAKESLTTEETVEMLKHVCDGMIASEPVLTDADRAIGDGDHGIGIQRGFTAAKEKLEGGGIDSPSQAFTSLGMALVTSMGGASGAIFGTMFMQGGKAIGEAETFDSTGLAAFLKTGLEGVMQRGKANPGDKTMIDALDPASTRAAEVTELPLQEALGKVGNAAEDGKEASRDMIATTGKARTLGERSLGHPDPGAISFTLIVRFMSEYVDRVA